MPPTRIGELSRLVLRAAPRPAAVNFYPNTHSTTKYPIEGHSKHPKPV